MSIKKIFGDYSNVHVHYPFKDNFIELKVNLQIQNSHSFLYHRIIQHIDVRRFK